MIRLLWIVAWTSLVLSFIAAGAELADLFETGLPFDVRLIVAAAIVASGISSLCIFGALARILELLTGVHLAPTGETRSKTKWEREIDAAYEADEKRGVPRL